MKSKKILIAGAGGFIGHHLVKFLKERNYWVRGIDIKYPEFESSPADEFQLFDLRRWENCLKATSGIEQVYHLAANMGGIGFIESHKAEIVHDNILINIHMLEASRLNKVKRLFYSSSACIYPLYRQDVSDITPLKEEDAYPAMPEDGYGWEKLFTERMCRHYYEDFGMSTCVARYHNVYGPMGTYDGGREKSPAALCRKVIQAKLSGRHEIEVWGDGMRTRSYMYIDDCLKGTVAIMESKVTEPLNLGRNELVSINQFIDIIEENAGIKVKRKYNLDAPKGVQGRNSDNTKIKQYLGWEPSIPLRVGIERTYAWIYNQMVKEKKR